MKIALATAAALSLVVGLPAAAQTSHETKVSHDTSMDNGVATATTKVTTTSKRKTMRPKKVLGVKVGHKTVTHKTTRESSISSNGDSKTVVKKQ